MNKTVTINISGIIFHIEEDAYERLSKYLVTIKGFFSKTEGGNEIMSDIEARVAELLQQKINAGKQVVLMTDVESVMNVMGKPEDFGDDTENAQSKQPGNDTQQPGNENEKIKRRMFRNPDDKAIGGVCSGLAAYFDVDTVWIRLAMFLLIFFGGISLWVYFILWIIIPEARTTADRLAMRGESANINNIMKNFKEEAEDLKNRADKYGKDFKSRNYGEAVRNNAATVLGTLFSILGRFIGFIIFCIGVVLLLIYLASLTGLSVVGGDNDITHWKAVIFESHADYILGVICFIIVVGIPVIMLVYAGIKLMFKVRYSNRWLNLSLGLLWIVGLICGIYITVSTIKTFNQNSRIKENYELHAIGDTIIIKMNPALESLKAFGADNEDELESYFRNNHNGYTFPEYNGRLGIIGFADLNVSESNTDSIEMTVIQASRGGFKKEANENAKEIKYTFKREKNVLIFDEVFFVPPGSKFRNQEVDIRIKLPKGKVVYFDKSMKHMLDDVENTTNTWDGDMVSRRWKMTEKGLECIDCEHLQSVNGHFNDESEGENKVEINSEGIKVNSSDAQIKIDDDGIKIKTPDKEWNIKNDKNETKKKSEDEDK